MDINILQIMKHRYPFLLIDKVIECEYLKSAKAVKYVSYNEPWVRGHYPDKPIFPGVLLIEAMGQASGMMLIDFTVKDIPNKYGYLVKVENCKFIRPVYPGNEIVMDCKMIERIEDKYIRVEVVATVERKKIATTSLIFMLKEEKDG